VRAGTPQPRTFTPRHRDMHRRTFQIARGWADVEPYYELRDALAPNLGAGFWNVPSGDCYVGVSPRWYVDVWGDHNREASLMSTLAATDFNAGVLRVRPNLPSILRAYGVTHLLTSYRVEGASLPFAGRSGAAYVYRIDGAARARFVPAARLVGDAEAAKRLLDPAFDPDREVLLDDASATPPAIGSATPPAPPGAASRIAITRETQDELVIEATSSSDGFLLLADTYYPGWRAELDGRPVPIHRANLSVRAVQLPKGTHAVRFTYEPPGFARGRAISAVAVSLLLVWAAAALYVAGRRSRLPIASPPHNPITT
jgi:hypothetical protein